MVKIASLKHETSGEWVQQHGYMLLAMAVVFSFRFVSAFSGALRKAALAHSDPNGQDGYYRQKVSGV